MQRLLVTGASGLLGRNFVEAARSQAAATAWCHTHTTPIPGVETGSCNIEDALAVRRAMDRAAPDTIVHAAALADVDYCETHPDEVKRLNVDATETLAREAQRRGASFVFISTDSVFDGQRGDYKEEDPIHPLNRYAQSKVDAENAVRAAAPDHLIIRTNFFGWGPGYKLSLSEWILKNLLHHQPMKLFTDVYITPLLTSRLSRLILALITSGQKGTFHVGSSDKCSKHEFGRRLAAAFQLPFENVTAVSVDTFPFKAPRPKDSSLNTAKAARVLGKPLPTIDEGLSEFRQQLEEAYPQKLTGHPVEWLSALKERRAHG